MRSDPRILRLCATDRKFIPDSKAAASPVSWIPACLTGQHRIFTGQLASTRSRYISSPAAKPLRIFTDAFSFVCSGYAVPNQPFECAFLLSDPHLQAYSVHPQTACQVKCLVSENVQHFSFASIEFERRSPYGFLHPQDLRTPASDRPEKVHAAQKISPPSTTHRFHERHSQPEDPSILRSIPPA